MENKCAFKTGVDAYNKSVQEFKDNGYKKVTTFGIVKELSGEVGIDYTYWIDMAIRKRMIKSSDICRFTEIELNELVEKLKKLPYDGKQ